MMVLDDSCVDLRDVLREFSAIRGVAGLLLRPSGCVLDPWISFVQFWKGGVSSALGCNGYNVACTKTKRMHKIHESSHKFSPLCEENGLKVLLDSLSF